MAAIKCVFTGNLGKDAELRILSNGHQVLTFPVATTKKWINSAGDRHERTIWVQCSMFGRRASALAPHLTKGTKIFVQDGELTIHRKDTPDGPREYWGVTVNELEFGSSPTRNPRPPAGEEELPSHGRDVNASAADERDIRF